MKRIGTALAAILMIVSGVVSASAATLRVGIQDDPDALDPALSGTYAGRFVFAALCDKLVDISADLKIVPQLAEAWSGPRTAEVDHLYAAQGRRRSTTARAFDAAAVKFNIERMKTMPDSKRKAELAPIAGVEVLAAGQGEVQPVGAVRRRCLPVLSDRAGMMVSPKAARGEGRGIRDRAGLCRSLQFVERKSRDLIRRQEVSRLLERCTGRL